MNELVDRYRRRADTFERLISSVEDDQWDNPSPCAAWTARDVVDHVLTMHRHMVTATAEAPYEPLEAFRVARADIERLLDDPSTAARVIETPAGPMTVADQIDQVASDDLPIHGWDLAKATRQPDRIDQADVEHLWNIARSVPAELMEKYRTPEAFGPGIEVFGPVVVGPDDATLHDRLLGFIGRDPAWQPHRTTAPEDRP